MNGLQQYQQVSRETSIVDADPHRLIQLLLDGALERIASAKLHMEQGDIEAKNRYIQKAAGILSGLRGFLNKDEGGELATQLEQVYLSGELRLLKANAKNDPAILDSVAANIRTVKEAWDAIRQDALAAS